jgi:hypothetical protein
MEIFEKVPDQLMHTPLLVCLVYGCEVDHLNDPAYLPPFTDGELVAVRRALRALAEVDKIKSWGRRFHDNRARWSSPSCPAPTDGTLSNRALAEQLATKHHGQRFSPKLIANARRRVAGKSSVMRHGDAEENA